MDGERACAHACSDPVANELVLGEERAAGAALVRRPFAVGDEWAVRDAHGGNVENRAEVESEAGSAWMVSTGGVDKEDVRRLGKCADSGLQQLALA